MPRLSVGTWLILGGLLLALVGVVVFMISVALLTFWRLLVVFALVILGGIVMTWGRNRRTNP
ncbi:MAG: hypothetical protein A3A27_00025 [Candidatus Wildermuthbacteria bacterium RIFCSPLOWO2_01_FULL_47_18]|uniref:Uncharacterized protein n=1 Tax=Candidatus Wildermuthbacteria bacterium RIFCSPLOWO2_01_FULL_47_18 TaxID=1802460 RepID=A0A1G2RKL9_9BACT|nr:MAG: hypothetical protein A3A27_00025 [Candidatus Wildermuthbacteria bacterium RIFCSPLOWO2_01_FULL_47_18]